MQIPHTMNKILSFCLLAIFSLTACDNEQVLEVITENGESYNVVSVALTRSMVPANFHAHEGDYPLEMVLINKQTREMGSCKTIFRYHNETWTCDFLLPQNRSLPDGKYVLLMVFSDKGKRYPFRLEVEFKDRMRRGEASLYEGKYKELGLTGEGTENSPYLITKAADLILLSTAVDDDLLKGYGYYFKQRRSIDIDEYVMADDRVAEQGWSAIADGFCGNYDGNGTEVENLTSTSDATKAGFFASLGDGAVIRNVAFTGVNLNTPNAANVGVIAASSTGSVTIEGCTVRGSVTGQKTVGGFIGLASGELNIVNCDNISLKIGGEGECVGGFVGKADSLTVDGATIGVQIDNTAGNTLNHIGGVAGKTNGKVRLNDIDNTSHLSLSGVNSNIGGLIGYASGELEVSKAKLLREALNSTSYAISTKKGSAGGFIGYLSNGNESSIKDSQLTMRINGQSCVGGLVGHLFGDGTLNIIDTYTGSAGIVEGDTYVGGVVGKGEEQSVLKISFTQRKEIMRFQLPVKGNENFAGGIAGRACNMTLKQVVVNANVTGNQRVGGILGEGDDNELKDSNISPLMSICGKYAVGGIAGSTSNTTITKGTEVSARINSPDDYADATQVGGIFGYAVNVELDSITSNSTIRGDSYLGGFIGTADGNSPVKLSGCTNKTIINGKGQLGGIVGFSTCATLQLERCANAAKVTGKGEDVGGILGRANNGNMRVILTDCNNCKEAIVSGEKHTGGLVGYAYGHELHLLNSQNYADVTGTGDVGGAVGRVDAALAVTNVRNTGQVSAKDKDGNYYDNAGGICGYDCRKGSFSDCLNSGMVEGKNHVGGILGTTDGSANKEKKLLICRCANTGHIKAGNNRVGGIAGLIYGNFDVHECYNTGYHEGNDCVGGIVGEVQGYYNLADTRQIIRNCYNRGDSKGNKYRAGILGWKKDDAGINSLQVAYCYNTASSGWGSIGGVSNMVSLDCTNVFYSGVGKDGTKGSTHCSDNAMRGKEAVKDGKYISEFLSDKIWEQGSDGYYKLKSAPYQNP